MKRAYLFAIISHIKNISSSLLICNILLLSIITQSLAQDTNIVKYFPLKVGNIWVYSKFSSGPTCSKTTRRKVKIVNSIILNSKKYFIFKDTTIFISGGGMNCWEGGSLSFDTLRIDSINGNIYKYSNSGCSYLNHEITLDSLKANLNNKILISCGSDSSYKCTDTNSLMVFGQLKPSKSFTDGYFELFWGRKYSKDIGLCNYWGSALQNYGNATLVGCVLDGIYYGDTTFITGINQISFEIPQQFSLSQNYPNPFNPSTKIKFEIPNSPFEGRRSGLTEGKGDVKLVVFDVLGQQVAELVNQQLSPGTYEVEWSANGGAAEYPSGIYFYTLKTESFSQTKRMVLVK